MEEVLDVVKSMKGYMYIEFECDGTNLHLCTNRVRKIFSNINISETVEKINEIEGRLANLKCGTIGVISFLDSNCSIPSTDDLKKMKDEELSKNNYIARQNVASAIRESIKALKTSAKVTVYQGCLQYVLLELNAKGYDYDMSYGIVGHEVEITINF